MRCTIDSRDMIGNWRRSRPRKRGNVPQGAGMRMASDVDGVATDHVVGTRQELDGVAAHLPPVVDVAGRDAPEAYFEIVLQQQVNGDLAEALAAAFRKRRNGQAFQFRRERHVGVDEFPDHPLSARLNVRDDDGALVSVLEPLDDLGRASVVSLRRHAAEHE